ncbi:MAG TPA: hypothetical protein DDY13_10660 [Cytophagales bacterium]|jgi:hypothetical protein|nr:hypothetical protein [Cytophagales bacterium]
MRQGIAIVYTREEQNLKNSVQLFADELVFMKNGRPIAFAIQDLNHISFDKKKWLLPIIAGGIFTSFSVIATFSYSFNGIILLTAFMLGLYLLYLGWQGSWMITLHLKNIPHHIDIKEPTDSIKAFIDFTNRFLRSYGSGLPEVWWMKRDDILAKRPKTRLYIQPDRWVSNDWVSINIKENPVQIHFEIDGNSKEIIPYLVEQIDLDTLDIEE